MMHKLNIQKIREILKLLDTLNVENYISPLSHNSQEKLVEVAKNSEEIYNIILYGFTKKLHKLQRFYYTHIYVFLPSKHWVSCDGSSSWRRTVHNFMIDFFVFKHPEFQNKIKTFILATAKNKLVGFRVNGFVFFFESIGSNYNPEIYENLVRIKTLKYLRLEDKLVLYIGDKRKIIIERW